MKSILALAALTFSLSASASELQVLQITGPAADELAQLLNGRQTPSLSCERILVPACPVCDGGQLVATCSLKVDSVHAR